MAPNLFLCVKTAVKPWTWCSTPNNSKSHFYLGKEPVEGVYAIFPNGKRYLVAIKPNANKDVEGIFRIENHNSESDKRDFAKVKVARIENASTTILLYHQTRVLLPRKELQLTFLQHTLPLQTSREKYNDGAKANIVQSTNRKIIKAFLTTTTGAVRQHKASSEAPSPCYVRQTSTQSVSTRINQFNHNDYHFLVNPLQIEYNNILSRYMFSSEIRSRSIVAPMCRSLTCMKSDMSECGKSVKRELFCLDDGVSWVVANAKRNLLKSDGEFLFVFDQKTGVVRRQTVQEVKDSRMVLWERSGKILEFEEEQDYSPLLRYLELDSYYA